MRRILFILGIFTIMFISLFNSCISEDDKIDYYIADTTMIIWSQKFNKAIFELTGSIDTIELGVDSLLTWSYKINTFISPTGIDTIVYGSDDFEAWRTKFNTAIDNSIIVDNVNAINLIERMYITPKFNRQPLINTVFDSLDYYEITSELDVLYLFAGHDAQASLLNWIGDYSNATPVNTPGFKIDTGFIFDGSTNYLNSNFAYVVDGTRYKVDSCSYGAYVLNNTTTGQKSPLGMISSVAPISYSVIWPWASNNMSAMLNRPGVGYPTIASDSTQGFFQVHRHGGNLEIARDGNFTNHFFYSFQADDIPYTYFIGASSTGGTGVVYYSDFEISCVYFGATMTSTQREQLFSIINYYMTQLNINIF